MRTPTTHEACKMTAKELEKARIAMGRNQTEMAAELETPLRTYQDWERGVNRVPGVVSVAMRLMAERDSGITASIICSINNRLDKMYPNGINHA